MARRLVPAAALLALLAVPIGTASAQERTCTPGSRVPAPEELRPQADLRCVDLSGADLRGLDLSQADLSGAVLVGADLSDATFVQAELVGADLTGATLHDTDLSQADLSHAVLVDVDLSGENLTQVTLDDVEAPGVDLSGARMTQVGLEDANLSGADLSDADAGQAEARGVDLSNADLSGADFTQADLTNADLSGADASGATFTQADVDGVDLDGVRGLRNYADLLLYGAIGLFVLLAALSVRNAFKPERPNRYAAAFGPMPAMAGPMPPVWSTTVPPPPAPMLAPQPFLQPQPPAPAAVDLLAPSRDRVGFKVAMGIIGSAIVVFGLHLAIGGGIGTFIGMLDPLAGGCDGPQCRVGTDAGPLGLTIGICITIFGFGVRARNADVALSVLEAV
jgi:uncharacterized protein YjbI with pentapeptide repeats